MRLQCGKQAEMSSHLCSVPKGEVSYSHCCDFLFIPAQGDWHLHSGSAACSESHSFVSDSRQKGFDRTWPHWEWAYDARLTLRNLQVWFQQTLFNPQLLELSLEFYSLFVLTYTEMGQFWMRKRTIFLHLWRHYSTKPAVLLFGWILIIIINLINSPWSASFFFS